MLGNSLDSDDLIENLDNENLPLSGAEDLHYKFSSLHSIKIFFNIKITKKSKWKRFLFSLNVFVFSFFQKYFTFLRIFVKNIKALQYNFCG